MTIVEVLPGPLVILKGRLSDSLSGDGLAGTELSLNYRQGSAWRPFPVQPRVAAEGWYRCAANMQVILAGVPVAVATDLRLTASCPGYQSAQLVLPISAANFTVVTSTIQIGGEDVEIRTLAGAPFVMDLALVRVPVMLAGLVVSDNDLDAPVAGAHVEITTAGGTTLTTGADGRFRFDTIPMALAVDLKVTAGTRTATTKQVVDFKQPMNDVLVSLTTPPGP